MAWRLVRKRIEHRDFGSVLARAVLRVVVAVGVLSVAARGARTAAGALSVAVFGAVVWVCVGLVRTRQQQVQADWPDTGRFFLIYGRPAAQPHVGPRSRKISTSMKFGTLRAMGHNFADSFASGIGLLIGYYQMDVFAEAASGKDGHIVVDFLNATTTGSAASVDLLRAIELYGEVLPEFCIRHGFEASEIKTFRVRFGTDAAYGRHFMVTIENWVGRQSVDRYFGVPGKRLRRRRR